MLSTTSPCREPWFVLADLCRVLGLGTTARVRERLDEGVSRTHTLQTAGGMHEVTIVSGPGMYEVVIRSDKPEATTRPRRGGGGRAGHILWQRSSSRQRGQHRRLLA